VVYFVLDMALGGLRFMGIMFVALKDISAGLVIGLSTIGPGTLFLYSRGGFKIFKACFFCVFCMKFFEVSDCGLEFISSFLPSRMVRGRRPMVDDRSLINGILYVVTTGCRWRDMPSKYGSYVTAWRMLRRQVNGI